MIFVLCVGINAVSRVPIIKEVGDDVGKESSNTWIRYGRGKVIKLYVRDRVTIKMSFALTG